MIDINNASDKTSIVSYSILGGTWLVIFMMIAAVTEGGLAPWDTTRFRPSLGSWERMLNDFFEGGLGSILPAIIIVGLSVLLYYFSHKNSSTARSLLTWGFVFWNVLFIVLSSNAVVMATNLNNSFLPQSPVMDMGYHRTWPALAITVSSSLFLLCVHFVTAYVAKHKDQVKP